MIERIQRWYQRKRHQRALNNIRRCLTEWHCDVSNLTDSELEALVVESQQRVASIGFEVEHVAEALRTVQKLARQADARL